MIRESRKKSRANRKYPRTLKTYNNKLTKLKAKYRSLFKSSTEAKINGKVRSKGYFCEKYPTFEDWLKVIPLKQVGRKDEPKVSTTISRPSRTSIWGR